ncbi:MAG: cell wall-active antibiotics response protein LiaF [Candidatus Zixiibacteriota bacterium]
MEKKSIIFGLILVALGALLLLKTLNIHLFSFVLPVALIIFGAWLITRHKNRERQHGVEYDFSYTDAGSTAGGPAQSQTYGSSSARGPSYAGASGQPGWTSEAPQFEAGKVKYSKFLGDMHIECQNVNLQNVEVSMFIGDLTVNLRGGRLTGGLNRMIISGFLGDVQILAPRDFPLYVHCSGFVGDVEVLGKRASGFGNSLDSQTDNYAGAESKLYIATNNFIGDIRVYQV